MICNVCKFSVQRRGNSHRICLLKPLVFKTLLLFNILCLIVSCLFLVYQNFVLKEFFIEKIQVRLRILSGACLARCYFALLYCLLRLVTLLPWQTFAIRGDYIFPFSKSLHSICYFMAELFQECS